MNFLEKDLEQIIFDNAALKSDREFLRSRGLPIVLHGSMWRQLNLGSYGVADLVDVEINRHSTHSDAYVNIYELKKDKIDWNSFHQGVRYARAIQSWIRKCGSIKNIEIFITLIGKEIELGGEFCYISNIVKNVKTLTYSYEIDGIRFKEIKDYYIIDGSYGELDKIPFSFGQKLISQFRDRKENYRMRMITGENLFIQPEFSENDN